MTDKDYISDYAKLVQRKRRVIHVVDVAFYVTLAVGLGVALSVLLLT